MPVIVRYVWSCPVAALIVVALTACGRTSTTTDVARVGGSGISAGTLHHWMSVAAFVGRSVPATSSHSKSRVLSFLIAAEWTLGEARDLGLTLSDADVRRQLDLQQYARLEAIPYEHMPRDAQVRGLLLSGAVGRQDKLWLMRAGLLGSLIEARRVAKAESDISRQQIEAYYRTNRAQFYLPERRDLEIIETFTGPPIRRARREIEAGKSFAGVARRVSNAPVAPGDLILNYARSEQSSPQLGAAIFTARPHVLAGPYKVALYYMFEVLKTRHGHYATLAEAEPTIRRKLSSRLAETQLLHEFDARWTARTSCTAGQQVSGCRSSH